MLSQDYLKHVELHSAFDVDVLGVTGAQRLRAEGRLGIFFILAWAFSFWPRHFHSGLGIFILAWAFSFWPGHFHSGLGNFTLSSTD